MFFVWDQLSALGVSKEDMGRIRDWLVDENSLESLVLAAIENLAWTVITGNAFVIAGSVATVLVYKVVQDSLSAYLGNEVDIPEIGARVADAVDAITTGTIDVTVLNEAIHQTLQLMSGRLTDAALAETYSLGQTLGRTAGGIDTLRLIKTDEATRSMRDIFPDAGIDMGYVTYLRQAFDQVYDAGVKGLDVQAVANKIAQRNTVQAHLKDAVSRIISSLGFDVPLLICQIAALSICIHFANIGSNAIVDAIADAQITDAIDLAVSLVTGTANGLDIDRCFTVSGNPPVYSTTHLAIHSVVESDTGSATDRLANNGAHELTMFPPASEYQKDREIRVAPYANDFGLYHGMGEPRTTGVAFMSVLVTIVVATLGFGDV